jgi:hypothetical protein
VFERNRRDTETVYWTGSLDETRRLARQIASWNVVVVPLIRLPTDIDRQSMN